MRKAIFGPAFILLILLAVGPIAAACGGGGGQETPAPTKTPQATAPPQATTAPGSALNVSQMDFRFDPDKLTAQAGTAVSVNVVNNGRVSHTFTIDELNVDKTLSPGQEATVTFTPSEGGTFTFYCRFHRASGMQGSLSVTGG